MTSHGPDDDLWAGDGDSVDAMPAWVTEPPMARYGAIGRGPFRFIVLGLFGLFVVFDLLQRQSYVRSALAIAVLAGLVAFELHVRGQPTLAVHDEGLVLRRRHDTTVIAWTDILVIAQDGHATTLDLAGGRELTFAVEGFDVDEADELRRHVEHRRSEPDQPLTWLG